MMMSFLYFIRSLFIKEKSIEKKYNLNNYPMIISDIKRYMVSEDFHKFIKENLSLPQLIYEYNCAQFMEDHIREIYIHPNMPKSEFDGVVINIATYKPFLDYINGIYIDNLQNSMKELDAQCKEFEDLNKSLGDDTGVDEEFHPAQPAEDIYSEYDETRDIDYEDLINTSTVEEIIDEE
jgi:hypothetical protein